MTTNDTDALTLADIDHVLPPEYDILPSGDPRNKNRHALRAVRHNAAGQTHYFSSVREYFTFAVSVAPQSVLAEEGGTRYLSLSAQYDADPWFHASVTHTVAALTRSSVILHRMKSDETSVRFVLSQEEKAVLIDGYQSFLGNCEWQEEASSSEFDPFLADVTAESDE